MKKTILVILIFIFFVFKSHAEVINDIKVEGNKRISKETIVLFSGIKINQNINDTSLNEIIKNLYSTNFFENISVNFNNGVLIIKVSESPIIQTILFEGIKKQSLIDTLKENLNLKEKNSFADNIFKKDQELITNILRSNGYYFAEVNTKLKTNNNNTIDIIYNVELGDKAYIKSIKFIGDKKIKDRKLRSVILSEEAKFWKIISNKKFLDIKRINLDEKLLKSYYKNKGYFNVSVESSSAQIINDRDFELIYNINAGEKYYFDKLTLNIPDDYPENSFKNINDILINLNGEPYSFKKIEDILDEIDEIAQTKDFEFVNVKYSEETVGNKLNLNINYQVQNCEKTTLPSKSFDLIYGSGILHHLDLSKCLLELNRLLRANGVIIFMEPLGTNPAINLYRKFTPGSRTSDEHPLIPRDFDFIKSTLGSVTVKYYGFFTLIFFMFYKNSKKSIIFKTLTTLDSWIFKIKFFRFLAWSVLIVAKKN